MIKNLPLHKNLMAILLCLLTLTACATVAKFEQEMEANKGLTKEQAYERTFFHIAPLVETELFHGKDLMTAAQYFMNPAMNMMGWTPGQAFAMSGILQSSGIAPSTSGTAPGQPS